MNDIFSHAHWIELLFLILTNIGLVLSVMAVYQAIQQEADVITNRKSDPALRVSAGYRKQSAWFFLAGQVVMLLVAVAALVNAPPPPPYATVPQSLIGITGYLLLSLLNTLNAIQHQRTQMVLNSLYDQYVLAGGRRVYDPPIAEKSLEKLNSGENPSAIPERRQN